MKIGGSAGGTIRRTIVYEADLSEHDKQVKEAQEESKTKRKVEKQEWKKQTDEQETESVSTRKKMELAFRSSIRQIYSQAMGIWRLVGQVTGLSKNAIYQIFTSTISAIGSLITTAYQSAVVWSTVPYVGPFLAASSMAVAVGTTMMQTNVQMQSIHAQNTLDRAGQQISGDVFY